MKKSALLFVLLAISVYGANVPYDSTYPEASGEGITRYSDFPLDNIHILRLQDASVSLGGNVSEMRTLLEQNEQRRSSEISALQGSIDSFQRSVSTQVNELQATVNGLQNNVANLDKPQIQVPANISFPPYVIILLGANIFLLVVVIILIFWLREQYYVHRETHKEEHIHPAPSELIAYVKHQLEHNKKLGDIRMELAGKGWTPGVIEHAIHAAREK